MSFFRGSSQSRNQTWVSCIDGRFFTVCATKEASDIPPKCIFYWDLRKLVPVPKTNTLRKEEIFFFLVSPQTDALIALTYSDLLETVFRMGNETKNKPGFFPFSLGGWAEISS